MYSRNTSKKTLLRRSVAPSDVRENVDKTGETLAAPSEDEGREGVLRNRFMPEPPPNYRGMIFDGKNEEKIDCQAEGIERLVKNDSSYCMDKMGRNPKLRSEKPFSHCEPPVNGNRVFPEEKTEKGLDSLINGLREKKYLPEDVLICAMIMLMLNSRSEDDILMILVLMMLL